MPRTRTIAQLRRELAAKERRLEALQAKHSGLAAQLASVDREMAKLEGGAALSRKARKRVAGPSRSKTRNRQSLADVLADVLRGKGSARVAEAAKLALAAGYKSASKQFGNIVSQTLTGDKRFWKTARGVYALKGGKRAAAKQTTKKGARKTAKPGKKAKPQQRLGDLLAEVSKGRKLLGVADAARLVLEKGYKGQAKNLQLAVNRVLMRDKRFGRVARGTYTLKGQKGRE